MEMCVYVCVRRFKISSDDPSEIDIISNETVALHAMLYALNVRNNKVRET